MADTILLKSKDEIIKNLAFKAYRSTVERYVVRFLPSPKEKQKIEIKTPWGEMLTVSAGDYIVNELDSPSDRWPVEKNIFEKTYLISRPHYCIKKALTHLVPLVDVVDGNPDQEVRVETLEGIVSVRAGDFYLARGIECEIWPYPKDKVDNVMVLAEEE